MTPQHLVRSLARVLPLFILSLAVPSAALGQSSNPGPSELAGSPAELGAALVDGAWSPLVPTGGPPSMRYGHSAIYDPFRDRMLVFAGEGTAMYNDVWTLSLAGTPAWTHLTPTGTPPVGRKGHSAIYDPVGDRMLVLGGTSSSSTLDDLWSLSLGGTPAWTRLSPAGTLPSMRQGHRAIYDPLRDRMVVFGGYDGSDIMLNDAWSLSLAGVPTWTQLSPTGPPPSVRYLYGAIHDPLRDRMVIFGGGYSDDSVIFSDAWVLSLGETPAWTQLTPTGAPAVARMAHSAIYDPVRDQMVVFAGMSTINMFNDVRLLSLAGAPVWTLSAPTGTPPSARVAHGAIYDPLRDRMVVFGGVGASGPYNDVWSLAWGTPIAVDDPLAQPRVNGLRPPAPNPTRGTIAVNYALAQAGRVQLGVYDASGRLVRQLVDGERSAGTETVVWSGTDKSGARVETGVYFMGLAGPGVREMRKVILIR